MASPILGVKAWKLVVFGDMPPGVTEEQMGQIIASGVSMNQVVASFMRSSGFYVVPRAEMDGQQGPWQPGLQT